MSKILIIGSGFIGSSLASWLSKWFSVKVADWVETSLDHSIEFVKCDIRNVDALEQVAAGAELLIHTAIIQIPRINDERRLGYEVNVKGTENVCEVVRASPSLKGMILVGSWHTMGERKISGLVDETFGWRPDMVEERARIYALSKVAQESIVRLFAEESLNKVYGVIRIGTALGANMPSKTAANIFIDQALKGEPLTPYQHSMHRPMLYVYVDDICRAFESYGEKIIEGTFQKTGSSLAEVVNVFYPRPLTILELAKTVARDVRRISKGKIVPEVKIVSDPQKPIFKASSKNLIRVNVSKSRKLLGLKKLTSPEEAIAKIITLRLNGAKRRLNEN